MEELTVAIEKELVCEVERIAAKQGLDIEAVIQIFMEEVVRLAKEPYNPAIHPYYHPENLARLAKDF
ncbi:MAG: hypothetical protein Q4E62_03275 [Sutterellaceae bacterium]|nr:hypothetical protein [Sutterellaceae bacterium]